MKPHAFSLFIRIALVAALAFVVVREARAIYVLHEDTLTYTRDAESRSGTDSQTQYIQSVKTESADDLAQIDRSAVTRTGLVRVISMIEKTGKDLGLTVTIPSINPGAQATTTAPTTVRVSIETDGGWGASLAFVHLMENLPHKAMIEESKLTLTNNTWRGNMIMTLTILPQ